MKPNQHLQKEQSREDEYRGGPTPGIESEKRDMLIVVGAVLAVMAVVVVTTILVVINALN